MRTICSNKAFNIGAAIFAAILTTLVGCGSSGVTTTPPDTTTTPASVQLLTSSAQLASSGTAPVTLTALVLNSSGLALSGQAVVFSNGGDSSAYYTGVTSTTDTNGLATATLNLGSNKTNRAIAVSATSGSISSTANIEVTGTTISISGNNSLALNSSTPLTISVKDSAGNAIPNIAVSIVSQNGNTIAVSPASSMTNASGQITATVTATNPATSDTITVTAAGTSKTQALTISSSNFAFTTPTTSQLIAINTSTPISLAWSNGGVAVASSAVSFSSSRGTITGASATTNASGIASAAISSPTTGNAIISATGPGGTPAASVNVIFYTTTASTITPQATPSTIQVTTGATGQTSNTSAISVVVRDASNNLVPKATVEFVISADTSGGYLSSSTATTDSTGSASVSYTAGNNSSAQNGVIISTSVTSINGTPITPVTNTVSLTVSGQATLVRLGTDNLVLGGSTVTYYQKKFIAIVTDVAGIAIPGATVQFKLRGQEYAKGWWIPSGTVWVQNVTVRCPNEDLNFNGIMETGEDQNGNNALEPGMVASIVGSAVTDNNGVATTTITYPKDHAFWTTYIVEARTGTNSNDPPALATFELDGLASDYNDIKVSPPGQPSPFGINTLCSDTL